MDNGHPAGLHVEDGYGSLASVLQAALNQSQGGKGAARHTDGGKPFLDQPILEIVRMLDGIDGHAFQVMKKTQEANRMVRKGQHDAAVHELFGVIVYAGAAILRIREL